RPPDPEPGAPPGTRPGRARAGWRRNRRPRPPARSRPFEMNANTDREVAWFPYSRHQAIGVPVNTIYVPAILCRSNTLRAPTRQKATVPLRSGHFVPVWNSWNAVTERG